MNDEVFNLSVESFNVFQGMRKQSPCLSNLDAFRHQLVISGGDARLTAPGVVSKSKRCIDTLAPDYSLPAIAVVSSREKITGKEFSAAACDRTFKIGVSTDVEHALLPQLLCRLRSEAPNVCVQVLRVDSEQVDTMLEEKEISLSIGLRGQVKEGANKKVLRVSHTTVLRADSMPGNLSIKDFCNRPHIAVVFSSIFNSYVDGVIGKLGYARNIALSVSQFNILPALLARTDVLAVVPDYVAAELVMRGGLRSETIPFSDPDFDLCMSWTNASAKDPAECWLRSRCQMMLAA